LKEGQTGWQKRSSPGSLRSFFAEREKSFLPLRRGGDQSPRKNKKGQKRKCAAGRGRELFLTKNKTNLVLKEGKSPRNRIPLKISQPTGSRIDQKGKKKGGVKDRNTIGHAEKKRGEKKETVLF